MNRRSIYTILAGSLAFTVSGLKVAYAAKRSKKPSNAEEALKLLQENGIVTENMTLEKLEAISARLKKENGGDDAGKTVMYIDISKKYIKLFEL